jgi:hypothetical protein
MTGKKVKLGHRPHSKIPTNPDEWVGSAPESVEAAPESVPMKRLTIDIPETLHRQIKTHCAAQGVRMSEDIRELLMEKYGSC